MLLPDLTPRLPDTGTNIFTVMSSLAQECQAINLSQGFPDFPVDPQLIGLMTQAMTEGRNQYAPMAGVPLLRQQIAQVIAETYGRKTDPETEITLTAGGTEALYVSIAAFVGAGDEVIIFDPAFDTYDPAVRLCGGVPVHLNLAPPDFQIPWDRVESAITPRTRMVIINSPHNPCSTVLAETDLDRLEELCSRHGILVISDEVYERIIFDDVPHLSVLGRPGLAPYALAVFSFGKTFHVTGWKTGYVVAAPELTREVRRIHQYLIFSCNTPVQYAFARYLEDDSHYRKLGKFYQHKRDFFRSQLSGTPFSPLPCAGSYFQLVSYEGFSEEPDKELAIRLTRQYGVAAIPVSAFYHDKSDYRLLRFCFAKKEETLSAAGRIFRSLAAGG